MVDVEKMDSDIHVLDLHADPDEVEKFLKRFKPESIEVTFDPKTMLCPVPECKGRRFCSETNFQTHWEERHCLQIRTFACPLARCPVECKRKSDMMTHLTNKHERNPQRLEVIMNKSQLVVRDNQRYVDPGLFVYKGSIIEENSTVQDHICLPDLLQPQFNHEIVKGSKGTSVETKRQRISLDEYRARKEKHSSVASTQTSWGAYDSMKLPALPDTREELQTCLAWLCNCMDQIGRTRELAKRKLAELENSELQRERAARRYLEKKNWELVQEIQRLKETPTI